VESVCDRIQIMNQGKLVFSGNMAELKQTYPEQATWKKSLSS